MMEKIDMTPMERALALAKEAAQMGEVPVGAVIVRDSDGMIVGEGYDRRETDRDPTAHAEMTAIRQASAFLGGWRLTGCTMYVTLQPCPMCAGAAMNARLGKVVWGAQTHLRGAIPIRPRAVLWSMSAVRCSRAFLRRDDGRAA